MIRPVFIADPADTVLPDWCRHKVLAVLRAFFDESGTHAGSGVTVICGFIGPRNQWRAACRKWRSAMKGRVFHYKNMRMEGELLNKLAGILSDSGLEVVSSGFVGDWNRAIHSGAHDWPIRFPSCYHMIFEACAQHMDTYSEREWHREPIAVTFSRQDEYARRAEDVWRAYQLDGKVNHIVRFGYGAPEVFAELQMADMIAYETFQCLKRGIDDVWFQWPLIKRFIEAGRMMRGLYIKENDFVRLMQEGDKNRRYLTIPAKPKNAGR